MKKFISFVMAAAMTLSLVPATAFAGDGEVTAKAKIVEKSTFSTGLDRYTDKTTDVGKQSQAYWANKGDGDGTELQLTITSVDYAQIPTGEDAAAEITVTFDNVYDLRKLKDTKDALVWKKDATGDNLLKRVTVMRENAAGKMEVVTGALGATIVSVSDDEIEISFTKQFQKNDIVVIAMVAEMDNTGTGKEATVSVEGDLGDFDDYVFATVAKKGITASVKKTVTVAEEEYVELNDKGLKIKFEKGTYIDDTDKPIVLKISNGFEFIKEGELTLDPTLDPSGSAKITDDNEITIKGATLNSDRELVIKGIFVEATSAKSGKTATITVKHNGATDSVEVAEVVDYKVSLTVDEDEDVPVMFSGVNVKNVGITDDSDHETLEITAEETFPGAWSMRKGFNFTLPEGVYVTDVEVIEADGFTRTTSAKGETEADTNDWADAFFEAYQEGSHKNFEFKKRVFDDVNNELGTDEGLVTFKLTLVADPTFEGDVVLGLEGDLVDTQEVTVAKFVKPYTVKAEQNDLIIDYRYTDVPTAITVTEAADGILAKNAEFRFSIETGYIEFEDDATFTVDSASELELKDTGKTTKEGELVFTVKSESDEAATITIEDMRLFMNRSIPAGPYDLEIGSSLEDAFLKQQLYAADTFSKIADVVDLNGLTSSSTLKIKDDNFVKDVEDYSNVVKEAFINVVTSGRDQDDASFTTKVVVPVGESYLFSGDTQVALDAPAYITAAGYTMLPVRAVAKALGINSDCVLWNGEARTATILYGQRIITMTIGEKVVYVNGSAIPASAAVEISNNRAFLPMRDLATALGVTDITWDAATKTATLNGNQTTSVAK